MKQITASFLFALAGAMSLFAASNNTCQYQIHPTKAC